MINVLFNLLLIRYLSYVMDVATPTLDCLILVHELLLPVIMRGDAKSTLSHQEVCIFFLSILLFLFSFFFFVFF